LILRAFQLAFWSARTATQVVRDVLRSVLIIALTVFWLRRFMAVAGIVGHRRPGDDWNVFRGRKSKWALAFDPGHSFAKHIISAGLRE
jgi:hypothetical protein